MPGMNAAQREYLKLLSEEAGEEFDSSLDETAAERRIAELRVVTGRGVHERDPDKPIELAGNEQKWPEPVDDPKPPRQTEIPPDAQHNGRPPHMNPSRPG